MSKSGIVFAIESLLIFSLFVSVELAYKSWLEVLLAGLV